MTQTEEPKMLGSGVFSEKRATHTFNSCHEVCHPTGIGQLSRYCLKKFQMTLKASMRDRGQVMCWGGRRGGAVMGDRTDFLDNPI